MAKKTEKPEIITVAMADRGAFRLVACCVECANKLNVEAHRRLPAEQDKLCEFCFLLNPEDDSEWEHEAITSRLALLPSDFPMALAAGDNGND